MTFSELTRLLVRHGWYLHRQGAGSAQIWRKPGRDTDLVIHVHRSKEVPRGTLSAILKQAGIEGR